MPAKRSRCLAPVPSRRGTVTDPQRGGRCVAAATQPHRPAPATARAGSKLHARERVRPAVSLSASTRKKASRFIRGLGGMRKFHAIGRWRALTCRPGRQARAASLVRQREPDHRRRRAATSLQLHVATCRTFALGDLDDAVVALGHRGLGRGAVARSGERVRQAADRCGTGTRGRRGETSARQAQTWPARSRATQARRVRVRGHRVSSCSGARDS